MADHVKVTGHNIKWDHFDEILAKGKTDYHCIIKETLFIQEFEPALNVNGESERFINLSVIIIIIIIITILYFTVKCLLILDSSPLIRFVIFK